MKCHWMDFQFFFIHSDKSIIFYNIIWTNFIQKIKNFLLWWRQYFLIFDCTYSIYDLLWYFAMKSELDWTACYPTASFRSTHNFGENECQGFQFKIELIDQFECKNHWPIYCTVSIPYSIRFGSVWFDCMIVSQQTELDSSPNIRPQSKTLDGKLRGLEAP